MPERFSRLVIMNTWLHHEGYEYTPAIQNWIVQNSPGGLFRDHVPEHFGWGTLMVVATRRGAPQDVLRPGTSPRRRRIAQRVSSDARGCGQLVVV
jgi:hypothetical protein